MIINPKIVQEALDLAVGSAGRLNADYETGQPPHYMSIATDALTSIALSLAALACWAEGDAARQR
jgi:hypothetical protein